MLSSILHTIKTEIAEYALNKEEKHINVHFVSPNSSKENLYPESINIALFGSNQERDIKGCTTFNVSTSGNLGLAQKPPLKLSIDLLLLFNFTKYSTALEYYEQVIGFFYNNDIINVSFDGYDNRVEVLLSNFSDRNEIEIWNSFNTPGIPMLRYFFRYALVSGKVKQLPIVRKVSVDTERISPDKAIIDAMILSFIYYPIEEIIQNLVQKTTAFCSINLTEKDTDETIDIRFQELLDCYKSTFIKVQSFRLNFENQFEAEPAFKKEFKSFMPSINGLEILIKEYREELANYSFSIVKKYENLCLLSKSNIDGKKRGLSLLFLEKLTSATAYLDIIKSIENQILTFTTVGNSAYIGVGKPPYTSFKENSQLSQLQLQKKWWELEDLISKLQTCYKAQIQNPLLDKKGNVYTEFIQLLENCKQQTYIPLETFKDLNVKYNKRVTLLTDAVKEDYLEAYTQAYNMTHYITGVFIPQQLTEKLQYILIAQNT